MPPVGGGNASASAEPGSGRISITITPAPASPIASIDRCRRRFLGPGRSEEHTSELQSLMRISYAVFCLKKKNTTNNKNVLDKIHNKTQQNYTKYRDISTQPQISRNLLTYTHD